MAKTFRHKKYRWKLPSRTLVLGERTLLMGVLNVTPDSFSDGGHYLDPDRAAAHALEMESEGADLIDIGGESTRPGAESVSAEEELGRILPVLRRLGGKLHIPISVDTSKAEVADAAAEAGAEIVNDVTGLRAGPQIAEVAKRRKLALILAHMRGEPRTMQNEPFARDAMKDVTAKLKQSISVARRAGIARSQIVIDPGLGFGKSYEQNFELIARFGEFARLGFPLLMGASRKSFVGKALGGRAKDQRAWGTAATVAAGILGGAQIVRVHDVAEMAQVARVADAIVDRGRSPKGPRG